MDFWVCEYYFSVSGYTTLAKCHHCRWQQVVHEWMIIFKTNQEVFEVKASAMDNSIRRIRIINQNCNII